MVPLQRWIHGIIAKAPSPIPMEINTYVNGRVVKRMVTEFLSMQIELYTSVNGWVTKGTDKAPTLPLMEQWIKVYGKVVSFGLPTKGFNDPRVCPHVNLPRLLRNKLWWWSVISEGAEWNFTPSSSIPRNFCYSHCMKKILTTLCLTLTLLLGSIGMSESADFQKGLTAAQSGDFATALREWEPLAEQGDADAQRTFIRI
jgi:hypothetical protein